MYCGLAYPGLAGVKLHHRATEGADDALRAANSRFNSTRSVVSRLFCLDTPNQKPHHILSLRVLNSVIMNGSRGNVSRALAPIAVKDEDLDDVKSAADLAAKPHSPSGYHNNVYQMKPLTERDAEEFIPSVDSTEVEIFNPRDPESASETPGTDTIDGVSGIDDGLLPEKPTVFSKPGSDPKYHGVYPSSIPEVSFGVGSPSMPDVNIYQHKKTVAQGMMDIALLSANANQLRYVLESGGNHPYYYASLTLIGISLLLQVGVGVGLILNSRYNVSYETSMRKANRINNYTVLAIFLITVMNVFISAFGIASANTAVGAFPQSPRMQTEGTEVELQE